MFINSINKKRIYKKIINTGGKLNGRIEKTEW